MKTFGLLGHPLSHSFSKSYFEELFRNEGLQDHSYHLFDIVDLNKELDIIRKSHPDLAGLNVTIPYKEDVIPLLDSLDPSAEKVGAVNVIKVEGPKLRGYNSDYFGFKNSLSTWLQGQKPETALVLGSGGASKAVLAALADLNISTRVVSRNPVAGQLSYSNVSSSEDLFNSSLLIVNTTPVGMHPNETDYPKIPYELLNPGHFLYDLVYNPSETRFMSLGKAQGAQVKNGLQMLHLQAEKSWEIWNA